MDQTKDALYALIRIALIGEKPTTFPETVDWNKLYKYAMMQGVAAIAMDGLQTLVKNGFSPIGLDARIKLRWFGQKLSIEKRHAKQLQSSMELASIWRKSGIRKLVLK